MSKSKKKKRNKVHVSNQLGLDLKQEKPSRFKKALNALTSGCRTAAVKTKDGVVVSGKAVGRNFMAGKDKAVVLAKRIKTRKEVNEATKMAEASAESTQLLAAARVLREQANFLESLALR